MVSSIIVLGGSVAGLVSALLLAREGHDVTVLERDRTDIPDSLEAATQWARPTVPQWRQAHNQLSLSHRILAERLPDVLAGLLKNGAREYQLRDWGPQQAAHADALATPRAEDLVLLGCSRSVLEWVLNQAVAEQPGITLRTGVLATGLRWQDGLTPRVTGVSTRELGLLPCDIVIDAAGRRSKLDAWARAAGAPLVRQEESCELTMHTRFFHVRNEADMPRMIRGNVSALIVDGVAAYAVLTGPDTVAVMVGRMSADTALRALREPDGFVAGAAALPPVAPWVDPRLVDPISPVHAMSGINNSLRLPLRDGRPLLLGVHSVGDALSTTNPFFGRGISLAMLHAQTVADGIAAEADPSLAQAELIGAQLADVAQAHWNDAVYMDRARRAGWRAALGLPAPQAAPAMGVPFAAAAADAEVWVRVIREMQLLDRPGSVREDSALQARIASLDLPAPPPVATRKDVLAALDNNPH